ncbi:unnamed protein product [Caenorhabditis auriculariae]|uniref:Uncharacterized protein n=1 Tax=Caenorhabditis auriculariae TaxID=2777116 RepID=A0A8S1HSG7_9PELO|nr:unnamed protein product [Caenorhabditis auriculariae]
MIFVLSALATLVLLILVLFLVKIGAVRTWSLKESKNHESSEVVQKLAGGFKPQDSFENEEAADVEEQSTAFFPESHSNLVGYEEDQKSSSKSISSQKREEEPEKEELKDESSCNNSEKIDENGERSEEENCTLERAPDVVDTNTAESAENLMELRRRRVEMKGIAQKIAEAKEKHKEFGQKFTIGNAKNGMNEGL